MMLSWYIKVQSKDYFRTLYFPDNLYVLTHITKRKKFCLDITAQAENTTADSIEIKVNCSVPEVFSGFQVDIKESDWSTLKTKIRVC